MGSTRQLDAALVDELREADELIWDWHRSGDGNVSVLLIRRRDIANAQRMIEIGLAGGEGRLFEFREVDDGWSLVAQGQWVG